MSAKLLVLPVDVTHRTMISIIATMSSFCTELVHTSRSFSWIALTLASVNALIRYELSFGCTDFQSAINLLLSSIARKIFFFRNSSSFASSRSLAFGVYSVVHSSGTFLVLKMVANIPYLDLPWISRSSVHLMRFVCCFFSDDPNASLHSDGKLDFVSSVDITEIFDIMLRSFRIMYATLY